MKTFIFALLALAIAAPAFANSGVTSAQAESAVIHQAHAFIARNAPDFGGSVHSPCGTNLRGDQLTVTCSGKAEETVGGDGSTPISFQCVGTFNQGEDGLFFQEAIRCR
jgi:hypothetical protein